MSINEDRPIRVVQYGLGPIGQGAAKLILEKAKAGQLELVGAIDIDPQKANKTLGSLVNAPSDVIISPDAEDVLAETQPDVVVHTTSSFMPQVEQQLLQCIRHGASIVSSTEELPYPFARHPEITQRLDLHAKERGVTILGTRRESRVCHGCACPCCDRCLYSCSFCDRKSACGCWFKASPLQNKVEGWNHS